LQKPPPAELSKNRGERVLFFSIWALILLGFSLWKFRLKEEAPALKPPALTWADELGVWFSDAKFSHQELSLYTIQFRKTPDRKLASDMDVLVGYELKGRFPGVYRGVSPCRISGTKEEAVLRIPNPERIQAEQIHLFLAR
jgi:hypothetical protein